MQIGQFARFAQNYATLVSEIVRKKNAFPQSSISQPTHPVRVRRTQRQ